MEEQLISLERQGWDALCGGSAVDFYGARLTPDAVFVVPGMVLGRDETLASWEGAAPWRTYELTDARVVALGDDAGVLTYAGRATRTDGSSYHARFTSIYVRSDDGWKLAFHQQTPDPA
jgi:ketosteroid isomerase-like protein